MLVRSRSQIVLCSLALLVTTGSLCGCKKATPPEKFLTTAEASVAAKKSLAGLKPVVAALAGKLAGMRKRIESIPPDLPGFSEVRGKFYSTDEAFGVMGPKLQWLAERLDAATKSKQQDELEAVSKDIDKTYGELAEMDGLMLQVLHEVLPFERIILRAKEVGAEFYTRKLATGYEVRAEKQGLEQRLIEFLEDVKAAPDGSSWFDFDRLLFSTRAEINREASEDQLKSIAEILKAYPHSKVKIGGYTDNTGTSAAQKSLSEERANATKKALVSLGVPAARLETAGFGADRPRCPANDTEECKSKNRRVSLLVTAK